MYVCVCVCVCEIASRPQLRNELMVNRGAACKHLYVIYTLFIIIYVIYTLFVIIHAIYTLFIIIYAIYTFLVASSVREFILPHPQLHIYDVNMFLYFC